MQIIQSVQSRIYELRDRRVILDFDLALLYDVDTDRLIRAAKRLIKEVPDSVLFKLNRTEFESIRDHVVALQKSGIARRSAQQLPLNIFEKRLPYAFTAEGAIMVSKMLSSRVAMKLNIVLTRTFVELQQARVRNLDFKIPNNDDPELKYFLEAAENLVDKDAAQVKWDARRRVGFAS